MIQTHERYRKEYNKAIYLVRDFRDVVLSDVLSEFLQSRAARFPLYTDAFDIYLLASLRGKVQGFGPWHDHVHSWLDSPLEKDGNLLVVKFEDLRRNPKDALSRILEFLRVSADPKVVRNAIADNCLERMRAKEDRRTLYKSNTEEDRHEHPRTKSRAAYGHMRTRYGLIKEEDAGCFITVIAVYRMRASQRASLGN